MEKNKQFDTTKAEQFVGNLVDTYNKASLTMMISLGHRSGLFDSMTDEQSLTSQQIADKTKLNERYVREWLGAMVAGGVIEYALKSKSYKLPAEHAAFLTRQAGADNFAIFAEYVSAVAVNGDMVLECFKNGGGISYNKFHRFYHAMDEDQSVIGTFFNQFLPSMPHLVQQLEQGISVLDAGCGTGGLLIRLASEFPNSKFRGLDLTDFAIEIARNNANQKDLANVEFAIQDLTNFDVAAPENQYDFVMTIDAIHDQQKPINVLKGLNKALKTDGLYLMVDINGTGHVHKDVENPFAQLLYALSCMHCIPVSLGQGGEGLGAMWGEEKIRDYVAKAGFSSVETRTFESDPLNNWFIISK